MLKILLPFLMLFSLSSFASLGFYDDVDAYQVSDQSEFVGPVALPFTDDHEDFERSPDVTVEATREWSKETEPLSPDLQMPYEVAWRSSQDIRPGI